MCNLLCSNCEYVYDTGFKGLPLLCTNSVVTELLLQSNEHSCVTSTSFKFCNGKYFVMTKLSMLKMLRHRMLLIDKSDNNHKFAILILHILRLLKIT
jgi:hypothetical protein